MTTLNVLLAPNILARICEYCDNQSLLNLSTTCRMVNSVAIQKIWRVLPSFVPVLYTLPPDSWMYENRDAVEEDEVETGRIYVSSTLVVSAPT